MSQTASAAKIMPAHDVPMGEGPVVKDGQKAKKIWGAIIKRAAADR